MSARVRRALAVIALVVVAAGSVGGPGGLRLAGALASVLDFGDRSAPPAALARPLWNDVSVPGAGPRLVQAGTLRDHGRPVGVTALLALPHARNGVRDLLVNVDLRRRAAVTVQPGPASRTPSSAATQPPAAPATAVTTSHATPALVRLSPNGPQFAPYDGTPALGAAGRDWPVSLIFSGHATVAKVKRALRAVGFTHRGEQRWLAYGAAGAAVRFDSDRGVKTANDANGTDVHVRLYAPPGADHFSDPRFGDVVVATVHLDHAEGRAAPPRVFGFSEVAERRVGDVVAQRLGWRVQRDRIALGNAEPYRRDLAAPDHVWWSNGRATLINVP
jgi:hypothetical protein